MSHHRKHRMPLQIILIALALTAAIVLTAIAGTRAWLYYRRELATMTKIQFSELDLRGTGNDAVPVDLGEINMTTSGQAEMPFSVHANPGAKYILQIGHTTNLPLSYEIRPLISENDQGDPIEGNNLNLPDNSIVADKTLNPQTYSTGDKVQQNAEPVYWQSNPRTCGSGIDNYVLIVSWNNVTGVIDKDTEMIYLTAGLGGYESNETAETTQAT